MEFLPIILSLLFIFLIGSCVISFLNPEYKKNKILLFSLALGVGVYCISSQMLLYNLLKLKWSVPNIFLPWMIIFFPLLLSYKKNFPRFKKIHKIKRIPLLLIFLICILLIIAFFESMLRPVTAWDAIASWYMGGKAFYTDGLLSPSFFNYVQFDYPPFIQLTISYMNIFLSKFNDTVTLLLFYAFYPSLLIVFLVILKEKFGLTVALFFTFLLGSTQNFIRHAGRFDIGNADLPLSYFFLISLFFLQKYSVKKTFGNFGLAAIALTSCALVKSDGIPFALVGFTILFLMSTISHKKRQMLLLIPFVAPLIYWKLFTVISNFPPSYLPFLNIHMERIVGVFIYMIKEMFNLSRWNLLWIFILGSIFFIKRQRIELIALTLILVQFVSYFYVYVVTPIPYQSHIENSFDRLLLQIAPICLYFAVSVVFKARKIKYN